MASVRKHNELGQEFSTASPDRGNDSPFKMTLERLDMVEKLLKKKFGSNFDSVRKAFLFMDQDHDGYITGEDVIRNFSDLDSHYKDINKLMKERGRNP